VIEPIRAGIPVSVYGPDWRGWIPAHAIKGTGVPNSELPALYERASVVVNDHWPAMRDAGFVSNRLYDVVAAGGRGISDDVEGIDEIFGGAVATYRSIPELLDLLRADPRTVFPDELELSRLSALVRARDSFDARARTLLDDVLAVRGGQV
jgi:spore maturation protein CgeB